MQAPVTLKLLLGGTVIIGGGYGVYTHMFRDVQTLTEEDIVITNPPKQKDLSAMEGITCTQTKTITIAKIKDTSYHLCSPITPTNKVVTTPSPAIKSEIFSDKTIFNTLDGTNHHVTKWTLESEPTITIYWFEPKVSASASTDKKDTVFLVDATTQNESEEGKIKKLILKIEQFREEQLLRRITIATENDTDKTVDGMQCGKKNKNITLSNPTIAEYYLCETVTPSPSDSNIKPEIWGKFTNDITFKEKTGTTHKTKKWKYQNTENQTPEVFYWIKPNTPSSTTKDTFFLMKEPNQTDDKIKELVVQIEKFRKFYTK